jgi:hypothetical protein
MQRKLTGFERDKIAILLNDLDNAAKMMGFDDRGKAFPDAVSVLTSMRIQGTSDGKPWVEPMPEVVIDDQWAAVWPRRWVMVSNRKHDPWCGPYRLGCVSEDQQEFVMTSGECWGYCRPATPEEIATVEPPETEKPEIGDGYREAMIREDVRKDREKWNGKCWIPARYGIVMEEETYRVPIDTPAPQYRAFANAAEYAPHKGRWVYFCDDLTNQLLPNSFKDHGIWHAQRFIDWDQMFSQAKFADDGTPFGVNVATSNY